MVFELYPKSSASRALGEKEISVNKNSMTFHTNLVGNYKAVEVYLNREESRVGFRFTDDISRGYTLQRSKTSKRAYSVGNFLKQIPQGIYEVRTEEGLYVIQLKEQILE